jgi:hypothetical protein
LDLISRADQFINSGHVNDFQPLILDCVNSRSFEGLVAVKRLARDMYGGMTFNSLFKAPAAYSLLSWRDKGLQTLVENAFEESSLKNFSLAFKILASISAGGTPRELELYLQDTELIKAISNAVGNWSDLTLLAQQHLNKLVMSIEDDDEAILFAATSLMGLTSLDIAAAKHLFLALSIRWSSVGLPVITDYEKLLAEKADDETAFQAFFEKHPLILDPQTLCVWAQPDFHGQKEPDFVIQRTDNTYVIVEIEVPSKPLITKANQLSADATHAITQVLEYRSFLIERFSDASATFPNFNMPKGLVVIGMEEVLTDNQLSALRRENESRNDITIVGFDALGAKAAAISQNMIYGKFTSILGRLR